jgi:hypothetical protein
MPSKKLSNTSSTTKRSNKKRQSTILGQPKSVTVLAFVFIVLFAAVGVIVYQASQAASGPPEIKSGMSTVSDWCMNHSNTLWVNTAACDGDASQQWVVSGAHIVNDNHCLVPNTYSKANNTPMVFAGCNSKAAENWKAYEGGFKNPNSGYCLADPAGIPGAILTLRPCATFPDQNWTATTYPIVCASGVHASPHTAQCIAKQKAAAIWNLSAESYISGGPYGFKPSGEDVSQWSCLVALWNQESSWEWDAANPSGAYGIPQSLPGSKMASAGSDWQSNAATQIKWGLGYIKSVYGNPCGAWQHEVNHEWYGPEQPA